jgi:hypothetical protein
MTLEIDDTVIAIARHRMNGWWEVSYWPGIFRRDQAITAIS